MKVLNVGPLELLFICLLFIIILGPKRAVVSIKEIGKLLRNILNSKLWQDISTTSKEIRDFPKKILNDENYKSTITNIDPKIEQENSHDNCLTKE